MALCGTCGRGDKPPGTLYTLAPSHYCESVRWALQVSGHRFNEISYLPGLHIMLSPTERLRKRAANGSTGKGASTPLYEAPDGTVLDDSWSILAMCLEEVPQDLRALLNEKVGGPARAIVYSYMLSPEMAPAFEAMGMNAPVSWLQRRIWSVANPTIAKRMREGLVVNDEYIAAQKKMLEEALDEVERLLPGGPFAPGPNGRPSASAIALSALLAPMLMPDEYTGGFFEMTPMEQFPEDAQALFKAHRERPAGRFVMEMYKKRMDFCKP